MLRVCVCVLAIPNAAGSRMILKRIQEDTQGTATPKTAPIRATHARAPL